MDWLGFIESSLAMAIVGAFCLSGAVAIFNRCLLLSGERVMTEPSHSADGGLDPTFFQTFIASWLAMLGWMLLTGDQLWQPSLHKTALQPVLSSLEPGLARVAVQAVGAIALLFVVWFAAIRFQLKLRAIPALQLAAVHCGLLLVVSTVLCLAAMAIERM